MRTRKKASFTADAACAARAHAAKNPDPRLRNPDHLAPEIVGMPFRAMLWPVIRNGFLQGYEKRAKGVYFLHQARTKRFDALWLEELASGTRQFVVLGAGFDTRAYRFAQRLQGGRVFEVDHPLTSAEKQRRLRRVTSVRPDHVAYVPVDFVKDTLADKLAANGFDRARRTFFLWEGVTPYLTAGAVDQVLAFVAGTAEGSSIAFDYMHARALSDPPEEASKQIVFAAKAGEPYQFGIDSEDLPALLEKSGLALDSDMGAEEMTRRYLVASDGRVWGRPPEFMGVAHARVPLEPKRSPDPGAPERGRAPT